MTSTAWRKAQLCCTLEILDGVQAVLTSDCAKPLANMTKGCVINEGSSEWLRVNTV